MQESALDLHQRWQERSRRGPNAARLARVGPNLLSPIEYRSKEVQSDLSIIRAREVAVTTRTKLIIAVRGFVKTLGQRLPSMDSSSFAKKAPDACPRELQDAVSPLLR